MNLWEELLLNALKNQSVKVCFKGKPKMEKLFSNECYKLLAEIQGVLADPMLADDTCFLKIDKMIRAFEKRGICCGSRRDF